MSERYTRVTDVEILVTEFILENRCTEHGAEMERSLDVFENVDLSCNWYRFQKFDNRNSVDSTQKM